MNLQPINKAGGVEGFCLIKSLEKKVTAKGLPYLDLVLTDASGEMSSKFWDYKEDLHAKFTAGQLVWVRGTINEYNGSEQLRVERIRPVVESDGVRIDDFVPGTEYGGEEMLAEITAVVNAIGDEELQKLNTMIIKEITELGCQAVGLNGKENKLLLSEKRKAPIDLGLVGHITGVNTENILEQLESDKIVVILPMGAGSDGKTYNVNADEAAAKVSEALKAEKLVLLTNVKGIMRNQEDANSFISTLTREEAKHLIDLKVVQAGMIPKVNACIHAINKGVRKAHMVDACIPHALLLEIFTDQGIGTEIVS